MLQAILVEIARAQEHGFSQQELDSAIAQEMADAESAYRERGQTYSVVGSPPNNFLPYRVLRVWLVLLVSSTFRGPQHLTWKLISFALKSSEVSDYGVPSLNGGFSECITSMPSNFSLC